MSTCPSLDELRRLDSDAIDDATLDQLGRHLEHCERCRHMLEQPLREHFLLESFPLPAMGDPWTTPQPPLPGFRNERELGRGGMGVVYLATREEDGRQVALKYLGGGPNDRARWRREAETMRRIDLPGVVRLLEVIELSDWVCLVMPYVAGGNLEQRLDRIPSPRSSARMVSIVARIIQEVHQRGVSHLDLKPSNLLIEGEPEASLEDVTPLVADFGLALEFGDSEVTWTMAAGPRGTASYMAPEQLAPTRATIGPAADVYALGAILYRMLTGRPPFLAASKLETYKQLESLDPVSPRRLNPNVPRNLEVICLACLRKDPAKRYPSAEALADDLDRFLSGKAVVERPTPRLVRASRWGRRNPGLAATALTGVLATVLAFGWAFDRARSSRLTALRAEADREVIAWNLELANRAAKLGYARDPAELRLSPSPEEGPQLVSMIELEREFLESDRAGRLDRSNLLTLGILQREIALLKLRRGDRNEASLAFERSRTSLDRFLKHEPNHLDGRRELIGLLLDRARAFSSETAPTLLDLAEALGHADRLEPALGAFIEPEPQLNLRVLLADRLRRGGEPERADRLLAENRAILARIPDDEIASQIPLGAASASTFARLGDDDRAKAQAAETLAMVAEGHFTDPSRLDPVFRWFDQPAGPLHAILNGLRGPLPPNKHALDWAREIESATASDLEQLGIEAPASPSIRMAILRGYRSAFEEIGAEHARARRLKEYHMIAHVHQQIGYRAAHRDRDDAEAQSLVRSGSLQMAEMFALLDNHALAGRSLQKALEAARRAVQRDPSSESHLQALYEVERRIREFRESDPRIVPEPPEPEPDDRGLAD